MKKAILHPLRRAWLLTETYYLPTLFVAVIYQLFLSLPEFVSISLVCFLTVLMIITYVHFLDRQPLSVLNLELNGSATKGFFLALLLTASLVSLATIFSMVLGQVNRIPVQAFSASNLGSVFMKAFVLQGFPEELAFRAYMVQTLDTSPLRKLAWSAGLFSLIHSIHFLTGDWLWGLETVFYAFAFGVLAFVLKMLFQTTWAAVAVHGGLHLTRSIWEMKGIELDHPYIYSGILMLLVSLYLIYRNPLIFMPARPAISD